MYTLTNEQNFLMKISVLCVQILSFETVPLTNKLVKFIHTFKKFIFKKHKYNKKYIFKVIDVLVTLEAKFLLRLVIFFTYMYLLERVGNCECPIVSQRAVGFETTPRRHLIYFQDCS
jgi:hypothetical protein